MGDHPRELSHVWLGGHYNPKTDEWFWTSSHKKIPKDKDESGFPPWTNIEGDDGIVSQPSSTCLNLDRADHVKAHFYGLDCDSKQPFVCKTSELFLNYLLMRKYLNNYEFFCKIQIFKPIFLQ